MLHSIANKMFFLMAKLQIKYVFFSKIKFVNMQHEWISPKKTRHLCM